MKLRLYHHPDGARIAYREAGTGPPLALLHSKGLTHREFEPVVDELAHRYRVVLPDLPLHGASEDRPTPPVLARVADRGAGRLPADTCGPRPLVAGHGLGAQLALRAIAARRPCSRPSSSCCPTRCTPSRRAAGSRRPAASLVRAAVVPGCDRVLARAGALVAAPEPRRPLTVTDAPGARDLVRHALMDLGGNGNRVRSWAQGRAALAARRAEGPARRLPRMDFPVLLLWADEDAAHPLAIAEEALDLLPDAQLRVLPRTGFLIAYDDPVGLARELVAFCG